MSDPGQVTFSLPKPGPALKAVLITVGTLAALQAFVGPLGGPGGPGGPGGSADSAGPIFSLLACSAEAVLHGQIWRLLTSGVLTAPSSPRHLIFTLIGLYFLSPGLERRWGSARFLRFLAAAVVAGNVLAVVTDLLVGGRVPYLASGAMFGCGAALSALAVAWAREYPTAEVRLFFFLPVSGRAFLWITLAFAVYGLVQPGGIPEGPIAPFGGILAGLLLSGTPSLARAALLRLRLAILRRRGAVPAIGLDPRSTAEAAAASAARRARASTSSLRVVQGGLEDELKKRKPPKDKRYLN